MKTIGLPIRVAFDELTNLFKTSSESISILEPRVGEGLVQICNLKEGLQVKFWECTFNQGIEMYSTQQTEVSKTNFTLAFFPDTKGFRFGNRDTPLKESIIWDTILISSNSNFKMHISSNIKAQCISISFSKGWLVKNIFEDNDAFKDLKENIFIAESFSLLDSMNASEKKLVQELFDISWKKSLGSFYIKSSVLKIVCDFFHKIKDRETFSIDKSCLDSSIVEIEKILSNNLNGKLPNIRQLACKFSLSELTIKKHFKKRYGVNMSTYFMRRKMESAKNLLHEKNLSDTEAAHLLGYRNVNHFIGIFRKYQE